MSASKCNVKAGGAVTLTGTATDEDGDSLIFAWKASAGSFLPASAIGPSVTWTAPALPGPVTITMTVTDEIDKRSVAKEVLVCTPMPSTIATSRTITSSGSPYILTNLDPLRIPAGVTLTIEPGVAILVESVVGGIEVFGTLIAIGTAAERIVITGSACSFASGQWGGIYIDGSSGAGTATLRHVDIAGGKDGIEAVSGAAMVLDSCDIYSQSNMGVSIRDGSSGSVTNCKIWDNGTGIYAKNSLTTIRECSIRYSDGNGLEIDASVDDLDRQAEVTRCVVANNGTNGFLIAERASPKIHNCAIFSNGEGVGGGYAMRLVAYSAGDSIRAENNFWGVGNTTETKIAALIFDRHDNEATILAYVGFTPWLTESPMQGARQFNR